MKIECKKCGALNPLKNRDCWDCCFHLTGKSFTEDEWLKKLLGKRGVTLTDSSPFSGSSTLDSKEA